jgi:hypothetical protein
LKNPLEEVIRGRKVLPPSGADVQTCLKRGIERTANKLRKATKNEQRWDLHGRRRDIGTQELERKQEACLRQEALSKGLSREASLHKPELFLPSRGHAERCAPVRDVSELRTRESTHRVGHLSLAILLC